MKIDNEKVKKNKTKKKNAKRQIKNEILEGLRQYVTIKMNFKLIAIIFIAFICIWLTPITFQNDTYYTIKIGELIRSSGIDMMDHFSWHENLAYTYPHWLYDLGTYFAYSIGEFYGVYLLTMILSVVLGVSIFLVNSKLTKNNVIPFIVTLLALYMLRGYITARAQLATFILFIWEIFFIEKFLEKKKIGYAIPLILESLLIANLHVAVWPFFFVLFLPYLAEYLICVIADTVLYKKIDMFLIKHKIKVTSKKMPDSERVKELNEKLEGLKQRISKIKIKREENNSNPYRIKIKRNPAAKWLIVIMIICAVMGLLTPIGDTPYTYLYKTMQGNTTSNISEHLPLTIAKSTEIMCMLVIFLAILIFTKPKLKLSDFFMIAGLCYLMLATRRQTSMFVLIGSVVLSRMIIDMFRRYAKEDFLQELEETFKNLGVILLLTVLVFIICAYNMGIKNGDEFVDTSSYPVEACDYILENIDLENAKFYNDYNYGSYMLFRGIPVFIDSRADLYTPEFNGDKDRDIFTDFIETSGLSQFYEDTFDKYGITHLIIPKKAKVNFIITKTNDENYKELYSDDNFVIYERLNAEM